MWADVEARIAENDRDGVVPLRRAFLAELVGSDLLPGTATKKMVAFDAAGGERLVWQVEASAQNFYLHRKWSDRVEAAGFAAKLFPYLNGQKDGARHSGLSRDWSFGTSDCVQVRVDSVGQLKDLIALVGGDEGELVLDPAAITRWIDVVRTVFPDFRQFDPPDAEFDKRERAYKLEAAKVLRDGLEASVTDDEVLDCVLRSIAPKPSHLLLWRTTLPLSRDGQAGNGGLAKALVRLARAALGPPEGHRAAMDEFASVWRATVPGSSDDPPRQIAEYLFFYLWPDAAIYIRDTVRQSLWREATGRRFPVHTLVSATYADELRFMRAVRDAFDERGLAPRDMIDVQSALWVVSRYRDESTGIDRLTVEGAMDAFDRHRDGVERTDILDRFGEPKDYWVLSTRDRPNRVYPTKPIIGFIRKKAEFSGGWGQKHDAAALLHAAGFVIVGETGDTLPLPEQYTHVGRGPDHVRLCAVNYFIEPSREDQRSQVEIRVGDLRKLLGPSFTAAAVSDAISDPQFADTEGITLIGHSGTAQSENETFTFAFERTGTTEPMTSNEITLPTNLILYGPPGTGKTYHSAFEAVRLCLGNRHAATLRGDRARLMETYRGLVSAGRIEFVTFHQSMSYEEFVEGLRPQSGGEITAGFRLEPVPGIFQRIAWRAIDSLQEAGRMRVPQDRHEHTTHEPVPDVFTSAPKTNLFRIGNWPEVAENSFRSVAKDVAAKLTEENPGGFTLARYREGLIEAGKETGLVPTGGWETHNMPAWASHPDRRWIVPASQVLPGAEHSEGEGKATDQDATLIAASNPDGSTNFVLIIDEINRANISKVFGELITLLEPDKRLGMENGIQLRLPYSKTLFGVPANLHIIGTMNTADRSIALLDTALRRRFTFRELMPDPSVLPEVVDGIALRRLLQTLNDRIEYLFDREHQIGHAYFSACRSQADIEDVLRYKVIPLLAEYFYEDWSRVAAVLGDAAQGRSRFLTARVLPVPDGLGDEDTRELRMRWTLNDRFDLSEFAA